MNWYVIVIHVICINQGCMSEFGEVKFSTVDRVVWSSGDSMCIFVWSDTRNTHYTYRGKSFNNQLQFQHYPQSLTFTILF